MTKTTKAAGLKIAKSKITATKIYSFLSKSIEEKMHFNPPFNAKNMILKYIIAEASIAIIFPINSGSLYKNLIGY